MYYNTEECKKRGNFFSLCKAFFLRATECVRLLCQCLHPFTCNRSLHKRQHFWGCRVPMPIVKTLLLEQGRELAINVQKCCAESSMATCSAQLAKQHTRLALRVLSSASCPARRSDRQGGSMCRAAWAGGRSQNCRTSPQLCMGNYTGCLAQKASWWWWTGARRWRRRI